MRICGIDLKGSEARLAIVEKTSSGSVYVSCETKKLSLGDDKDLENIKHFKKTLDVFLMENKIGRIALRQRARKGTMAGGAISFKLEAIIQLSENCEVVFVSPVAVAAFNKKNSPATPAGILAYQADAYSCALTLASK